MDASARRHARYRHSRSRNPEAGERPGRRLFRPRLLRAGRLRRAAPDYSRSPRFRSLPLCPGRKASAFDEFGYYRAQGDNAASPNSPSGALLTYYLREDNTDKIVLTVTDSTGRQVRELAGSPRAGIHRTPWNLREEPPAAGALVKPGRYTVTLGKVHDAEVSPLAGAQTVEVIALEASNR